MGEVAVPVSGAAFDAVGRYRQDEINGFSRTLLTSFLEIVDPVNAASILDAMGGDGNLTLLLHDFCKARRIPFPASTVLEMSRVQSEFAGASLARIPATVICGDVLTMKPHGAGDPLPEGSFDRVMIKSGTHEVPLARQETLYRSIQRVLRPGGRFVNLGFVFDDPVERDEFRAIARVKDTIAGMRSAAQDRHFLTRDELYSRLEAAGFVDIRAAASFDYTIRSGVVAEQYFRPEFRIQGDLEHQAAQLKALLMRRNGRIRFEGDGSVMTCPGEITVARRPTWAESNAQAFRHCPYDFLRHMECHADMLDKVLRHIPVRAKVIDLGCGPGLLAERLIGRASDYRGFEISPDFVQKCRERYGSAPGFAFTEADIMDVDIGRECADSVTLLNVLYLPGLDAVSILRKAHSALVRGGRLIVSGPTSRDSYRKAEPFMRAQLERDGKLAQYEAAFRAVGEANARLLPGQGNYWSMEGMTALLTQLGFRTIIAGDTDLYYGYSYTVVAEK